MNTQAKTLRGRTATGEIITATLGEIVAGSENSEWTSTVHCPAILPADKTVAGVDAEQALKLAEMLVMQLFDQHDIKPI